MATYTVTTSNWNSSSFWSSINQSSGNHFLDFRSLPSNYTVNTFPDSGYLTINDGTTTYTVGDSGYGGSADATLGGSTLVRYLNRILDGAGDNAYSGSSGSNSYAFYDNFGTDTVTGGTGSDTIGVYTTTVGVTYIALDATSGTAASGANSIAWSSVEGFEGSDIDDYADLSALTADTSYYTWGGDDTILGGQGANTIIHYGTTGTLTVTTFGSDDYVQGGNEDDVILLGSGDDYSFGSDGDDSLSGEGGTDTLEGWDGSDTLSGGVGDDVLTGGSGDDVFVLTDGDGGDTITDFDLADDNMDGRTNDQLDLSGLTDSDGNPVNVFDITVVDDGSGNARLNFPNGEYLILQGVAPSQMDDGAELRSAGVACFTEGTLIRCEAGEVPVEDLKVGDCVLTLDNGLQPLRWVGSRHLDECALAKHPRQKCILIPKGVLRNYRDLMVSPQHALLVGRDQGLQAACFARAKHLAEAKGPVRVAKGRKQVTYYHLMCARHEVLFANGAPTESFYPGPLGLCAYPFEQLRDFARVLRHLTSSSLVECYGPPARRYLRRHEVARLQLRCASREVACAEVAA